MFAQRTGISCHSLNLLEIYSVQRIQRNFLLVGHAQFDFLWIRVIPAVRHSVPLLLEDDIHDSSSVTRITRTVDRLFGNLPRL